MRPDPYKQARSRQYLAKQKAKYGKKAATKGSDKDTACTANEQRIPRWLRNLPSNIDRYQDDTEDQGELMGASPPEALVSLDDYDFSKSEDITRLVEEFALGGSTAPSPSTGTGNMTSCSLYDQITGIDVARLEQVTMVTGGHEFEESIGLPNWFMRYGEGHTSLPKIEPSARLPHKPKLHSLPAAVSQSRTKASKEKSDLGATPPKEEKPRTGKKSASEEVLDSILDA